MPTEPNRPRRVQFPARIRLQVDSDAHFTDTFASNISAGGMFVPSAEPPAVGTRVVVEFMLPNETVLCRVAAEVVHARPGEEGDPRAGMGLHFVQLDPRAKKLVGELQAPEPVEHPIEVLGEGAVGDEVLGIDLGTTNSCVAIVHDGSPMVLTASGYDTVPSIIFIPPTGAVVVGHKAFEQTFLQPTRSIVGAKRFMGRPYVSREVRTYGAFFQYELAPDARDFAGVRIRDRVYPLEWVASRLLIQLRAIARKATGKDVRKCVITVPASYGEVQRNSVLEAATLGGLEVVRLLTEPIAAAVAFGYGRNLKKTVLVYDLGGGTFDATVVAIDGHKMEVLATDGDPFLGGHDFDDRLTEYLLGTFERTSHVSIRNDLNAVQRVRFAAELAKKQLSEVRVATIDVPALVTHGDQHTGLKTTIEGEFFERLTEDLVNRTLIIVESVLTRSKRQAADIDDVLLVGGQSRSAHVIRVLTERFGKKPSRRVHPDHAVALGAAMVGAAGASKRPIDLREVLSASIHVMMADGALHRLLERGTALPAEVSEPIAPLVGGDGGFAATLFRGDDPSNYGLIGKLRMTLGASGAAALGKLRVALDAQGLLTVTVCDREGRDVQELVLSLNGITQVEAPPNA